MGEQEACIWIPSELHLFSPYAPNVYPYYVSVVNFTHGYEYNTILVCLVYLVPLGLPAGAA